MNLLPQFFYGMVVIGSLSMVGDGGGCGGRWEGVGRALGGSWEDIGRALGGRWWVVRVGAGSLIYRLIKSLHCSGYLLVYIYYQLDTCKFPSDPVLVHHHVPQIET